MQRPLPVCTAALLMASLTQAQITVTSSAFPIVGDTLFYAIGNQADAINAIFTPPGGDQSWDLSGLQQNGSLRHEYLEATTGLGIGSFSGAELRLAPLASDPDREHYYNVSPSAVEHMGTYKDDPLEIGMDITTTWLPSLTVNTAPINFFDIRQFSSGAITPFLPSAVPPGMVEQLPVFPDSLRIRENITRLEIVDAWGTLAIPGGAFPVLRVKRTEYLERRLDGKILPLGWLDISDLAIQTWGLSTIGVDTTITYSYINDQSKEAIAICTLNNAQNAVTSVQYKVADITTTSENNASSNLSISVFPNPTMDLLLVQTRGVATGAYTLVINDAMGREVRRERGVITGDHLMPAIDLFGLMSGVYHGSIVQQNGRSLTFRFVKE